MSAIRSKNTKIELTVRKLLFGKGLRYRLNTDIVGKPDMVFIGKKVAVFIHGCFWHQHGCNNSTIPKTNRSFWDKKLSGNKQRDQRVTDELTVDGWLCVTLWECEIENDPVQVVSRLIKAIHRRGRA